MPGVFGFYGTNAKNHLNEEIGSLLTHNKSWFDYNIQNHPFGFHGVSDFKNRSNINNIGSKQKSIILYGDVFYFKKKKISQNPTEFILNLYKKNDNYEFINYLNGSFIISLYDNGKIIIINDKIGSKNLFYTLQSDNLFFSSEIKGIIAEQSITPTINLDAISEYFTFSYLLGNKTFIKEIQILPPGNILIYDGKDLKLKRYYYLATKRDIQKKNNLLSHLKEFSRILENAIKIRMENKKKIGIFLSGGLDSRLIAGFASKISKEMGIDLISFTFGTKNGRQEKIATKIAEKLKINNLFFEIPSDFIAKYAEEIIYKGDGLIRIRDAHFISAMEEVKSNVDDALLGLFCSELFGETMIRDFTNLPSKKFLINSLYNIYNLKKLSNFRSQIFSQSFQIATENQIIKNFVATIEEIPLGSFNEIAHHWEILQRCRRYIIPISNYIGWYVQPQLPFLDHNVIDFALNLPFDLRIKKKFIHKANKYLFPSLSNIPWEKSGLPVDSPKIFIDVIKIKRYAINILKRLIERISQNAITIRNLDYRAYDYFLRSGSKNFMVDILLRKLDKKIWDCEQIRNIVQNHIDMKKNNNIIICDLIQVELIFKRFFS